MDLEQSVHRIHMHAKYEFDTAFHISQFGYWYKMVVTKKEREKRESKKGTQDRSIRVSSGWNW